MQELKGKTAIVTGASRGIGAACAKDLAARGANVVLVARTHTSIAAIAAELNAQGAVAMAVDCDVSDYAAVSEMVARSYNEFGGIDILVNNAGVIEPIARLADSEPAQWNEVIDINLKGVYHGLRAVIPLMEAQGQGVIINISSGAATSALEGWSHYCASKAAVLSLTRCADKEYRDKGIRVIGLSPGTVATEMQVVIKASGINPVSQLDPSVHIPPSWVAQAIAWLCANDEATEFCGTDFSLKEPANRQRIGLADAG